MPDQSMLMGTIHSVHRCTNLRFMSTDFSIKSSVEPSQSEILTDRETLLQGTRVKT